MQRNLLLGLVTLSVAACVPRSPAPVQTPHYVVGGGYELGGTWSYPSEAFQYDESGLASVLPTRRGLTADGEAYDATAMVAAHRTLQLPSIVRVTNLENGRTTLVRVNDRGPAPRGRLIGLSRRAADVLGLAPDHVARVRVQVEDRMSQALRTKLGGGPAAAVLAAPVGRVTAEVLAPPPGQGSQPRASVVSAGQKTAQPKAQDEAEADAVVPDRLPATATPGVAHPGQLMIRAGSFGLESYARALQAKLGGIGARVDRTGERYQVVAGPFGSVSAADMALDRAVQAGVGDARIDIE